METSLGNLTFGRPGKDDAGRVLELLLRCDIAESGEPDSDLEDIQHDWGQIDLERDAWLALDPQGALTGYAAVLPWGSDVRYDFYVDPSWETADLGRALLALCQERGPVFAAEREDRDDAVARTFVAHRNKRDLATVKDAGFRPGRFYFQMQIDTSPGMPEPAWPPGLAVRTFKSGQDDRATYELIQAAFDQPGRKRPPFDEWRDFMVRSEIFDPNLWFLVVAGEQMVGAALCFPYSSQGWVRQLGVAKEWRRKGIASALLGHVFVEFGKRGFDKVGLSVESKRPDAHLFYRRVGMRQVRQYDEFLKPLHDD